MKFKIFTFLMLLAPIFLSAQTRNCAAMEHLSIQQELDPMIQQNMDAIEKHTQNFIQNRPITNARVAGTITIPVVVHIVWRSTSQNLSDAQIQSQLDVLNEDFQRLNADADNTWSQAGNPDIEFCLASVDPSGNSTNGITRTKTRKRSFSYSNDGVKFTSSGGIDAWPASDYMNMWVCDLGNGLLGYAQFPGGNDATDGVVIDYAYFGSGGTAQAPYDLGRTATHEVGHWLNLRHIWGDGGCTVDDFVSDTPLSDASNGGCNVGHVSCGSVDMVQNYMDYSYDACMNLFTNGQNARMRALFDAGGAKASLLNSPACGGGGSGPTCDDGVQNGDETGVDCGGSDCPACPTNPTCDDGVQNGDETGVDCGGPDCDPCNTGGTCDAPTGLAASNIKRKRATLNWDASSGATSYTVEIRVAGSSNWSSSTTSSTNTTASGLSNGVTYEWRVRSNCSSGNSDFSGICSFIAGNAGSGGCNSSRIVNDIKVYPNPARDILNVQLNSSIVELRIYDMVGKEIQVIDQPSLNTAVNVSNLNAGLYFIRTLDVEGETSVVKFYINK